MKLILSLRLELAKILRQRGTWAGPLILLAVAALTAWGLSRHGPDRALTRRFGDMVIGGKLLTGATVARYVMEPCLMALLPLLVAAVVGGLVAGERKSGLLRTWLCRPVSRFAVLTAKQLAAWLYAAFLTVFLGLAALGLGYAFFGGGDLIDLGAGHGVVVLGESLALQRLALAYGLAALLMGAMASLTLLASTLFDNPLVAAAVAVAFLPFSTVLGALPYFQSVRPYLLTSHFQMWRQVFRAQVLPADFVQPLSCVLAYCFVPYIIALVVFRARDIVS